MTKKARKVSLARLFYELGRLLQRLSISIAPHPLAVRGEVF
jgi:hypothetical protein